MSNYTVYANQTYDLRRTVTVTTTTNLVYAVEKAMQAVEEGVRNFATAHITGDEHKVVAAFRNDDGNARLAHDSCPSTPILENVIKTMYDVTLESVREERKRKAVEFLQEAECLFAERGYTILRGTFKNNTPDWTTFDFIIEGPREHDILTSIEFKEEGDEISAHLCDGCSYIDELFTRDWTLNMEPDVYVRAVCQQKYV